MMMENKNFQILIDFVKDVTVCDDKEKRKLEGILETIKKEGSVTNEDVIFLEEIKDPDKQVKQMSQDAIKFSNELHRRSTIGFVMVMVMYVVAFGFGIALLTSALYFAFLEKPDTTLVVFFGTSGGLDLAFLLYKPAKEIIKSRASATQLLAIFKELQFVSIWSGKTYGKLYKGLEVNKDGANKETFEQMIKLLTLKTDLAIKFIATIEKHVKQNEPKPDDSNNQEKEKSIKKSAKNKKLEKSNQAI